MIMDMHKSLEELNKYLPFIDYVIQSKHEYCDKFTKLRQWIATKKKFSKEIFPTIEKSIIITYKSLNKTEKFPQELHNLFTIDLCSDDEEQHSKSQSSNDKPLVTLTISDEEDEVSYRKPNQEVFDTKPPQPTNVKEDPNKDIIARIDIAASIICNKDKIPEKNDTIAPSRPNSNDGSPIFKRRSDFTVEKKKKKKHKHKRKKKRNGHNSNDNHEMVLQSITIVSSSDDDNEVSAKKGKLETAKINDNNNCTANKNEKDLSTTSVSISSETLKEILSTVHYSAGNPKDTLESAKNLGSKTSTNLIDNSTIQPNLLSLPQPTNAVENSYPRTENISTKPDPPRTIPVILNSCTMPNVSSIPVIGNSPHNTNPSSDGVYHSNYYNSTAAPLISLQHSFNQMQQYPMPNQQFVNPTPPTIPPNSCMNYSTLQPFPTQHSFNITEPAYPANVPMVSQPKQPNYYQNKPIDMLKDPRIRKLISDGQYGHDRQPAVPSTLSSAQVQQNPTQTYGEYSREKQRIEEQRKRLKEESDRLKEEMKRIAKEREQLEHLKQTKTIKNILNKHNDETPDALVKVSNSKKIKTAPAQTPPQSSQAALQNKSPEDSSANDSNLPSNANQKKYSKKTPQSRILKELECSVIGYSTIQDFMAKTIDGKRRSSVSARIAISQQLNMDSAASVTNKRSVSECCSPTSSLDDASSKRRRIENEMPKLKQCYVNLKRLSSSELTMYTSSTPECLKLPEKKAVPETQLCDGSKSITNSFYNGKNIDCRMTERNCDTCAICKRHSKNLTSHFIHYHRSESYLSRLTWEELDDLLLKVPFAEEVASTGSHPLRYKLHCPFCPEGSEDIVDTFCNLRRHFSAHTGEYAYQCKVCSTQKPFRRDIQFHQGRTKCKNAGIKIMYQYPTNSMVIYMYICNICNFVQLNRENVYKHLREQHGKPQLVVPKFVKEYTLAAIKDGPIERIQLNTLPEILPQWESNSETVLAPLDENVVVGNEPLTDDGFSCNIKEEPLNEPNNLNRFAWENMPTAFTVVHAYRDDNNESNLDIKCEIETTENVLTDFVDNNNVEVNKNIEHDIECTPEQAETEVEPKPNAENLAIESVKALLYKMTSKTGIRPDLVYQCALNDCGGYFSNFHFWSKHMTGRHNVLLLACPHCCAKGGSSANLEMPIEDFDEHFKAHCLHTYLCFHCEFSCADELKVREHAAAAHSEFTEIRIERIPFNITYSYYVIIGKEILSDQLEFLIELNTVLRTRLQQLEAAAILRDNTSMWPVKENTSWIEELSLPTYEPNVNKACLLPQCGKSFDSPTAFLEHLETKHNNPSGAFFKCSLCYPNSKVFSCAQLVQHNFLHSQDLYICCCCLFFTYNRRLLSEHIRSQHDKRDVGVISLLRSKSGTKAEVAFVFPAGSKTFNTSRICYCGCGQSSLRVDTYVSHLRREHLLKLRYFCEHCDESLPQLQSCDEHFSTKHGDLDVPLKVRCQITCSKDRLLSILSANPLQLRLNDEIFWQIGNSSPIKVALPQNPSIKSEIVEEDEPILMEEDEVVAENEATKALSAEIDTSTKLSINCANICKLKSGMTGHNIRFKYT